jgi:hypothetical protein
MNHQLATFLNFLLYFQKKKIDPNLKKIIAICVKKKI